MIRIDAGLVVLVWAGLVWGQAAPPAPAATQPQGNAAQLHEQAVALMRAKQFAAAAPLLERAYHAAGEEPGRALVLNRAILALALKRDVLPAMESLTAYLKSNPTDEAAVDILGAAIDRVRTDGATEPPVVNAAIQQLTASVNHLNAERRTERKWGGRWLAPTAYEAEATRYEQAYRKRSQASRQMEVAADNVRHARSSGGDVAGAEKEYRAARDAAEAAMKAMPPSIWPTTFEPVDPSAPAPGPATQPTGAQSPTTHPASSSGAASPASASSRPMS